MPQVVSIHWNNFPSIHAHLSTVYTFNMIKEPFFTKITWRTRESSPGSNSERTFVAFYFFDLQWHDYVVCELIFVMYAFRLSSQVKGFACLKRKRVESPANCPGRSGRFPGRTIRRQTGLARRGRRTACLNGLSADRRISPAGRRAPGESSGPAGLTAGPSGPEAGGAGLIAGLLLCAPSNGQIPTYL
jgi:hypothetical protein